MTETILDTVGRVEQSAAGKAVRADVKRSEHADLPPRPPDFNLLETLVRSEVDRIAPLLPIRYHRMASSPFSFYRGTAGVMARDLAPTPVSGITVQLSGDAHCANFGAFATPERNVIFDVRDFDETLPGPWEWDLKRLVASLVLAGRDRAADAAAQRRAARHAVEAYARRMHALGSMSTLDVWYSRVDVEVMLSGRTRPAIRKRRQTYVDGIGRRTLKKAFDDMTQEDGASRRFVDEPPLVYHAGSGANEFFDIEAIFASYRDSISADMRSLFDRYRLVDWVVKVVGVGSVGTRCAAALMLADADDPLILQIKEAGPSVLEHSLPRSRFANHGERVVTGQRIMQAASDIFLGWTSCAGRDYYVRQLRDMKGVPDLENMGDAQLTEFAEYCGRTLAGAHARGGGAPRIAGYLGKGAVFAEALAGFALAYADRTEADYAEFTAAIADGHIEARES